MLVLASQSPRRSEILRQAGIPFIVRAIDVDETPHAGEGAHAYVERLALAKAMAAEAGPGETVLAADTTVTIDGMLLGKPVHEVLTGICLRRGDSAITDSATTAVWFQKLSGAEIDEYVASGEPEGKAGAYAIQGLASKFVERIEGCYFNVMGLPVSLVYRQLERLG